LRSGKAAPKEPVVRRQGLQWHNSINIGIDGSESRIPGSEMEPQRRVRRAEDMDVIGCGLKICGVFPETVTQTNPQRLVSSVSNLMMKENTTDCTILSDFGPERLTQGYVQVWV
jgi:hypothetical protein